MGKNKLTKEEIHRRAEAKREKIKELVNTGWSGVKIRNMMHCSNSTITDVKRELGILTPVPRQTSLLQKFVKWIVS